MTNFMTTHSRSKYHILEKGFLFVKFYAVSSICALKIFRNYLKQLEIKFIIFYCF